MRGPSRQEVWMGVQLGVVLAAVALVTVLAGPHIVLAGIGLGALITVLAGAIEVRYRGRRQS